MLVGLFTVLLAIAAIVIDFGLWLGERRDLQSVADLAALAGSQDLPSDDDTAIASALTWAAKNGFQDGVDGVEVTVELLCKNTLSDPPDGICTNSNPPGAGPSDCQPGAGCDSLRVTIRKPAEHLFTSIFGFGETEVTSSATAVAGLDIDLVAMDTMILLDASSSMSTSPCNRAQNNNGCPIKEARDAAHSFVDVLVAEANPQSQVGYVPYNYCYNPPGVSQCVFESIVLDLTTDSDQLHTAIDATRAGFSTNVCLPLLRALQKLSGPAAQPGAGVRRSVVLLTDGDNNYHDGLFYTSRYRPPSACRPSSTSSVDLNNLDCGPAWRQERELDVKTWQMASQLKSQGVKLGDLVAVRNERTAEMGVITPEGAKSHRITFGGPPSSLARWAANLALNWLRTSIEGKS